MPLWLLKFLPLKKILSKYWKPILAIILFVAYSATLSSCVKTRVNSKWELAEAQRVQAETEAKNKALSVAADIKKRQDALLLQAQEELVKQQKEADTRLLKLQTDLSAERRMTDDTTYELRTIQDDDGDGPMPLDDGVRDLIQRSQDRVRSRR